MNYLLIAFVVLMVVSPVFWFRASPGQARITAFRKRAAELGLKVQLVPQPDAEKDDKHPSAVVYICHYPPDNALRQAARNGQWILLRNSRRGSLSPWPQWRWFRAEAPGALAAQLEGLLMAMPDTVYALRADSEGIGAYLRESGDIGNLDALGVALRGFVAQD